MTAMTAKMTDVVEIRPRRVAASFAHMQVPYVATIMFVPRAQPVMSREGNIAAEKPRQVVMMLVSFFCELISRPQS